jgi:hypothetical protein
VSSSRENKRIEENEEKSRKKKKKRRKKEEKESLGYSSYTLHCTVYYLRSACSNVFDIVMLNTCDMMLSTFILNLFIDLLIVSLIYCIILIIGSQHEILLVHILYNILNTSKQRTYPVHISDSAHAPTRVNIVFFFTVCDS